MLKNAYYIFGCAIIIGAIILAAPVYNLKRNNQYVKTVGYASQSLASDILKWNFSFTENSSLSQSDLAEAFTRIKIKTEAFKKIWEEQKIVTEELVISPVQTFKNRDMQGKPSGYDITQNIYLVTKDLDQAEKILLDPTFFSSQKIMPENSYIQYYHTELDSIKKQLLAKATLDARSRANQIAGAAGNVIKGLRSARAGIFQITEPFSNEVSDYGIYSSATRKKQVSVTVTTEFYLD